MAKRAGVFEIMRRDMELVRSILLSVADSVDGVCIEQLINEKCDKQLVGYHIRIMEEAGLIHASIQAADNDPYYYCTISSLTWEGNDYLDAVASENVWNRVRKALSSSVGSTSFDVIKSVASKVGQSLLLAQLGNN